MARPDSPLAISNNVPSTISRFRLRSDSADHRACPKEDSQVQIVGRQDIFPDYSLEGFIRAFANDFILRKQAPIPETLRTIFLFERKP
jgi:hypothetical protein